MRKVLRIVYLIAAWGACGVMFPFAVTAFFFNLWYLPAGAVVFLILKVGVPRITRNPARHSLLTSVFVTEICLILLLGFYYTSDRRPSECNFDLDRGSSPY